MYGLSAYLKMVKGKIVPIKTFSAILNGRAGISPEMALRLSKVFGRTPEGWLRLQLQYDLWNTRQSVDIGDLKRIEAA